MADDVEDMDIVLLHGLGASHAVWAPSLKRLSGITRGRVLALDLPGHGGAAHLADYALEPFSAAVAEHVFSELGADRPLAIIGHSLGGTLALMLASHAFSVAPQLVCAVGVKVNWTDEEVAKLAALASRPAKSFDTCEAAAAFFARVAGLSQTQASAIDCTTGVKLMDDGWQLSQDPRTNIITPPPMADLMALAKCPVHLACGASDAMVQASDLMPYDKDARTFAGAGHNVMLDAPDALWDWFAQDCCS